MSSLCIIPCGKRKIWDRKVDAGPTEAKLAYIGTFHRLCQQYANLFFSNWVIISAKHGYLRPNEVVIENYDLSFGMKHEDIISIDSLKLQVKNKNLFLVDHIVVLGGKKFKPIVEGSFGASVIYEYPLADCQGLGYMQKMLKDAIKKKKPIHHQV